jgi:hypothetical protein
MKAFGIFFLPLIALGALQTAAQDVKPAQPPAMSRMRPDTEHARLSFLVGSFATETRVLPGRMSATEAVGKGTSRVRWGLDSMFIFIEEESVNPLLGNYKGFGILGYDPGESQYVLSMYNNFGDHPQYRGAFSGDTLILSCRVLAPRGAFDQKLLWYKTGETIRLQVLNNMGTGFVPVVDQSARRSPLPGEGRRNN